MDTVQGKTAVITGGASGIGRATAHSLARRGAQVIVADIDATGAAAVASDIIGSGGSATGVRCDVGGESAFEELKAFALDAYGRVDIVMNNVGVLTRGLPDHIPVHEWQRVININLLSVVRSNDAFLPLLVEQGSGHIVNTASFAGLYTYAYDRLPYAASKAAIVQISEGLALYLRPKGIGVTLLCPGPVRTNIAASLPSGFGPATGTRGPGTQFGFLEPEVVGEQVADAIVDGTFWLPTDAQVRDVLVQRASDWDAFIDEKAREIASSD
ncbi:SDR family oxidoreductase [Rhodococcus artemisiae]|uniref:SDR family oxidoreductase n=1 Tax=Rhodococcus artemisiae TaxID=714159 RepID=A0ABU7L6S3_9NOCA|nr:SDR family oxidoreductase [Rhodococcus artemisiae]MEE2057245.1 SDR family oxidoreductase [Rhodococcus artemisiae]